MERKLLQAKHRNTYTRNAPIKCLPDLDWKMLEDTDDVVSLYSSLALQTKRIFHLGYILNLLFDGIFEECQERLSYLYWTQREYILCFFSRYQNIKNSKKKVSGKNSFYHCFWYILFKIKLRTIVKHHSYFFFSSLTMRLLSLLERFFVFLPTSYKFSFSFGILRGRPLLFSHRNIRSTSDILLLSSSSMWKKKLV